MTACSPLGHQDKLGQKKVEIEKLLLKDKAIMAEFHGAVGDNSQFYDVLLRIFKKRWLTIQHRALLLYIIIVIIII